MYISVCDCNIIIFKGDLLPTQMIDFVSFSVIIPNDSIWFFFLNDQNAPLF